jgi:FkbM family methyltransferase
MSKSVTALVAQYADAARNLGMSATLHYAAQRARDRWLPGAGIEVRSQYARHPLWCRHGTSDVDVFGQIFVHREYRCLDHLRDAAFVVDCGANVGFSAAYFLSRFPRSEVVAVEPDPGNFRAMERNLAPYGARATLVPKAVWSHATGLVLTDAPFGDAREWAVAVREAAPGETPTVEATDIRLLIGDRRVDVLKIDVEGAERQIFAGDCTWLEQVDNIVIETHGPDCEAVVRAAIAPRGYALSRTDELLVCLSRDATA